MTLHPGSKQFSILANEMRSSAYPIPRNRLTRIPPHLRLAHGYCFFLHDQRAVYVSRWHGLTQVIDEGRIDLDNNSVERSFRPLALSRKNALFAGSDFPNSPMVISQTASMNLCHGIP